MTIVKINSKNQVVIPMEICKHLGIGPGDELLVVLKSRQVIMMPKPKSVSKALAGSGKGLYGKALSYLEGERRSWKSRSM